jgi:NifB/MoaA-like Fe-S oxidoreductase
MKTRQGYLAKAMKYFSEVKHEMLREDKDECFKEIQRVKDEHDRFWNQCNKAKEDKRQKYVAGQETFRNKIKENLSQNRDKLKNAEDALERFQEKASSVRDKIKNEKASEKWRTIWEGWLADALAKVESTKSYIEKLKEWIREGEAKLDGLK